ncbi:protein NO VEIN domain-containing protein [Microbacterium sp.]|uniref:protein NO VEIN domain-containing protein n=1 Tax=Microbacterium sp. TaxID=51671 RepID=UPI003C7625D2
MSIPPDPIVTGALRWLELVPTAGVQRARALFSTSRDYADLTPTQYAESWQWVQQSGLLGSATTPDTPERLLEAIIVIGAPSWFPDADVLIQDSAEIPDDALSAAAALGVSPLDTLRCIRRAWGKVDTEIRREVGNRGEHEVLRHLVTRPQVTVDHVASWSDAHGYDIAVFDPALACHLEVKATTRQHRLTLYLSRNEFETMRTDASWQLAAVVLDARLQLSRIYSVARDWIVSCAPADIAHGARWESARFEVPPAACESGIRALAPFLQDPASPLLTGRA